MIFGGGAQTSGMNGTGVVAILLCFSGIRISGLQSQLRGRGLFRLLSTDPQFYYGGRVYVYLLGNLLLMAFRTITITATVIFLVWYCATALHNKLAAL